MDAPLEACPAAQPREKCATSLFGGTQLSGRKETIESKISENETCAHEGSWRERILALRNLPPLLKIVWEAGPGIVSGALVCRTIAALIPLAMLAVSKRILDGIQAHFEGRPLAPSFWYLVAGEFALAMVAALMARGISFCDAVLADRYHAPRQHPGHGTRRGWIWLHTKTRCSTTSWSAPGCRPRTVSP